MKKQIFLIIFVLAPLTVLAEEPLSPSPQKNKYPTEVGRKNKPRTAENNFQRWAVHSNVLGFLQFGPVISGEYDLTRDIGFTLHARFTSLGALTPILHEADIDEGGRPDKFSGFAFGGGPLWFFDTKKDKAYAGLLFEYEFSNVLYMEDYVNEWSRDNRKLIFMLNAGYRFRFGEKLIPGPYRQFDRFIRENFFLNAGIYAGAEKNNYAWRPASSEIGTPDNVGKEIRPFGMIEISVGMEF